MQLTDLEKLALRGLLYRDSQVYQIHMKPLQDEFADFKRLIEQRLGLNAGAIDTTHSLDAATGVVVKVPTAKGARKQG